MRAGWTAALIQGQAIRGMTWFSFPELNRWQYRWRHFKLPLAVVSFLLVYGIGLYLSGFYMAEVALSPLLVFFILLLASNKKHSLDESISNSWFSFRTSFGDGMTAISIDMSNIAKHLWRPYLHNLVADSFVADNGEEYKIPIDAHRWTKPFFKKLIILDIDSRPNANTGEILNSEKPDLSKITGRTAGFMNHYLYGRILPPSFSFIL